MKTFKNTISTLVLLAALASTASAQFSIGLRGGMHLANWAINDDLRNSLGDPAIRLSPVVGAVMEIRFTDNIALQPEMIFLQNDSRYLLGLTNINTSSSSDAARNRGISISTGVLFTL